MGYQDTGRLWRCEDVGGGNVCFDRTGIIVEVLVGMFAAGDEIDYLADQYSLSRQDIEAGIRLVVASAFTKHRGLRADVIRAMEERIPAIRYEDRRRESSQSVDAVDPHVTDTGKPSTRD